MKITTSKGESIDFEAAHNLMDFDLCEEIHRDGVGYGETEQQGEQDFYNEYCRRHLKKFGEPFAPDAGLAW